MALGSYDDDEPDGRRPATDPEVEAVRALARAVILKAATDAASTWAPSPIRGSAMAFLDVRSPVFRWWCEAADIAPEAVARAIDRARREGHVIRPYRQKPGTGRPHAETVPRHD